MRHGAGNNWPPLSQGIPLRLCNGHKLPITRRACWSNFCIGYEKTVKHGQISSHCYILGNETADLKPKCTVSKYLNDYKFFMHIITSYGPHKDLLLESSSRP